MDDIHVPNAAYAVFVRSPHAHAVIKQIETGQATSMPNVLAVLKSADWEANGGADLPCIQTVRSSDGTPAREVWRPVFAKDRVRHVGEIVVLVVASTPWRAADAAEAIEIDYELLPCVTDACEALELGAPQVHDDVPGNVVYDWSIGDKVAVAQGFARATHVTRTDLVNNRLHHLPIEPRAVIGAYDPAREHYTLWSSTQVPHLIRQLLVEHTLRVAEPNLRVIAPDVGGGFGLKAVHYAEEAAVLWASRLVGRPVRWTSTRTEAFIADVHGRAQVAHAEMAFDAEGRILALRVDTVANMGSCLATLGPAIPSKFGLPSLCQLYAIPATYARVRAVYTNTLPVDAYRGAGQPEATYIVERLIEQTARELRIDPLILRERNLIPANAFPHTTATGAVYDSGDYPALLARMKEFAGYEALRVQQQQLRESGTLVGIGISAYIESAADSPSRETASGGSRVGSWDAASVRIHPSGAVTIYSGGHSHGQGHDTTFRQVAADYLGCKLTEIQLVSGDTDRVHAGMGTFGSRSITVIGSAIAIAAQRVVIKGGKLAAHLLECAETDIDFENGDYVVRGIHLAVVLVDPECGLVRLLYYVAVDDCGRVINPMIVEGQVQGGVAQGVGQALLECIVYDVETGQPTSGSLLDYAVPRAADLPSFRNARIETPAPDNPLGVKGIGEAGAVAAPPAIVNAVLDALAPLGVRHLDMPLTPLRVWEAIRAGGRSS